jgi:hypothetical protein
MQDVTVVYYSNNREQPAFAANVQRVLLDAIGDLPLISVSQKPMDLGTNICVGDVGSSTQNTWRQFQIGAMEAKTKFVCTAEADCLYPPDYFTYRPPSDDAIWCAKPMFVLMAMRRVARQYLPKKLGSFGASFMGRETIVRAMEEVLRPLGQWGDVDEKDDGFSNIYQFVRRAGFRIRHPVVSIKTDAGLHHRGNRFQGKTGVVDYWGEADDVLRRYGAWT